MASRKIYTPITDIYTLRGRDVVVQQLRADDYDGLRRKGRMRLVRNGSTIPRENAGDKYNDTPIRTGSNAYSITSSAQSKGTRI